MITAIYARQSVDKKDSISIETQIDECKAVIKDNNYKEYIDKGYSGKNIDRPHFREMFNDIKSGLIEKVVVYKLDRMSRNLLDFANMIEIFKKYNVDFESCNEKFDTKSPMGMAMVSIIMVFAQLERETIQMRVKDNYYARGAKGFYMGGRAPYGFSKTGIIAEGKKTHTFEENPEQAPILIKMYEMYSETDMSLGKISQYLNKNNIPAAEGGLWDSGKVSRILRSPVYVKGDADIYIYYKNKECIITNDIIDFIGENGCYLYGKREANERKYTSVKNHVLSIGLHKGIIDSQTWLLCQYKLDSNKQIKNTGKGKHSWLSGKMKCGYCGYSVSVILSRGNKYLSCRGRANLKNCKGYSRVINVNEIENFVEEKIFLRSELLKTEQLNINKSEDNESNKIKIQILEIDKQIENLLDQLSQANNVTMKYINERVSSLDNTKNLLLEKKKKFTIKNAKIEPIEEIFKKISNWSNISMESKKSVCNFFIDKIWLTDEGVNIDFNI